MSDQVKTVLVVEDEPLLLEMNRLVLRTNGYHVLSAQCGQEAMAILETYESPIHLLLTDLNIPGLRGDLLAEKACSLHPGLKVIFLTGSCCQQKERELKARYQHFLHKPFGLDEMLSTVQALLA